MDFLKRLEFKSGEENARGLNAKFKVYEDKEHFGYKITLPAGYTATVDSTRPGTERPGWSGDQDKVIVNDTSGDILFKSIF